MRDHGCSASCFIVRRVGPMYLGKLKVFCHLNKYLSKGIAIKSCPSRGKIQIRSS